MNRIVITKENQPSSEQFGRIVDQMLVEETPFTKIMRLMGELAAFEAKYNMPSDLFYMRFMRGEMGDDRPFIRWTGRYEQYLETRETIEAQILLLEKNRPTDAHTAIVDE